MADVTSNRSRVVEEHVSPDGRLRLLVIADPDGGITLGFEGSRWHTHADLLSGRSGLPEAEAVRRFVDELIEDRSVVAIWRQEGRIRDIAVVCDRDPEDIATDPYSPPGESIELRSWAGRPWIAH